MGRPQTPMGKVMHYNMKGCILMDLLIEVLHQQFDIASREHSSQRLRLLASLKSDGNRIKDENLG
jgi:hypothetical protein